MATFQQLIDGLNILGRNVGFDKHIGGADHDIIIAASLYSLINEDDKARLKDAGWHIDSESQSWAIFC